MSAPPALIIGIANVLTLKLYFIKTRFQKFLQLSPDGDRFFDIGGG
jgi:hypothetical protein